MTGGARGPGVFFIVPCIDIYQKVDLRTASYEIPPQEVRSKKLPSQERMKKVEYSSFPLRKHRRLEMV